MSVMVRPVTPSTESRVSKVTPVAASESVMARDEDQLAKAPRVPAPSVTVLEPLVVAPFWSPVAPRLRRPPVSESAPTAEEEAPDSFNPRRLAVPPVMFRRPLAPPPIAM